MAGKEIREEAIRDLEWLAEKYKENFVVLTGIIYATMGAVLAVEEDDFLNHISVYSRDFSERHGRA